MNDFKIIDLEFLIRPDYEGGPIISGQSKSLNISCHVRLDNEKLEKLGLSYIKNLCKIINENMVFQYKNGLIK